MKELTYHIVDVFAEGPYRGNQLAVFLDAGELKHEDMQSMALETGFAETTFIRGRNSDGSYSVSIFTPETEIPFAGHPTLGTAWVIQHALESGTNHVVMNYRVGHVPVDLVGSGDDQILWMQQVQPDFLREVDHGTVASVLGLEKNQIRTDFPILKISTGIPFYIVPVISLDALSSIQINPAAYDAFEMQHPGDSITPAFLSFTPEAEYPENNLQARMHYKENGMITEDAATGSANGCLLAYLLETGFLKEGELALRVEQGFRIKRPSVIHHHGSVSETGYLIRIGGMVQHISRGTWFHR